MISPKTGNSGDNTFMLLLFSVVILIISGWKYKKYNSEEN